MGHFLPVAGSSSGFLKEQLDAGSPPSPCQVSGAVPLVHAVRAKLPRGQTCVVHTYRRSTVLSLLLPNLLTDTPWAEPHEMDHDHDPRLARLSSKFHRPPHGDEATAIRQVILCDLRLRIKRGLINCAIFGQ
jgi:hypothetical protein